MPHSPDTLPARNNGKHPGGRPSKRTPERVKRLAKAIAAGLPDRFACALVGITEQTLSMWRHDPEFQEFNEHIKAAQAAKLMKRLDTLEKGLPGWQAISWILERCYARDFCRPEIQFNQEINITSQALTYQSVRVLQLPDPEFDKLAGNPNYSQLPDGTLQRVEGSLCIKIARFSQTPTLPAE